MLNSTLSLNAISKKTARSKTEFSRISVIKKHFKNSFGFLKNSSRGQLNKSSITLEEDDFSSKKNQEIRNFEDYYEELELIGEGAHAVVKKARNKLDNSINAVKITRANDPEIIIAVKNEYINSTCLKHSNIIKIEDLFIDELKGKTYYVMEYLNLKSLDHCLKKQKKFTESETITIISQTLQAVTYLHKKGICHRDIKPKNMMIDLSSNFKTKIIDFGISKNFISYAFKNGKTSKNSRRMYTCTGTLAYCAPEIFNGEGYNHLVDIWAIGIITYQLLSGTLPFNSEYVSETIEEIMNKSLEFPDKEWSKISSLAKDFIRRLLNRKIFQRISASEALLHPFLSPLINRAPKKTHKKNYSPEFSKKFQTQCFNISKDFFFSAHKMTMNPTNDNDFKILKLETSLDDEEEKEKEPDFLQRKSRKFERKDFIENFRLRKEIRNPFKKCTSVGQKKLLTFKSLKLGD